MLPALMTILSGAIYYKVSDLFRSICDKLESQSHIPFEYDEIYKLLHIYNILYKLVHEIEKVLSTTAFLLLFSEWLNLYLVLVILFKLDNRGYTDVITWESIFRLVMGSLTVIAQQGSSTRKGYAEYEVPTYDGLWCFASGASFDPLCVWFRADLRIISSKHHETLIFVHEIEKVISTTAFLLLFSEWLNLYLVLVIFFKLDNRSFTDVITWESIFTLVMPSLTVIAVVLCASKSPVKITDFGRFCNSPTTVCCPTKRIATRLFYS
ncbi:uncharacterized protein CEXT_170411 [Caerostris extrusa]|uniref:Gustatory receptor n=1 Tax=Caerostris extrusa TaxID=172846 RepID=A0AAV4M814_CAEEX|nr:uncharacterized protein CEXT_170411 [Caerostris extrusa]